jgi:murein DD-endopeptidase MepM/ murein hydrolase activator NlpD
MFGNDRALYTSEQKRQPDRRQLSLRWLSGVFLTGVCSLALMGGALHAALDGRQQLTEPLVSSFGADEEEPRGIQRFESGKGDRVRVAPVVAAEAAGPTDKRVMNVATMVRQGDADIIKTRQFVHVASPLPVGPDPEISYPPFDPLAVFAGDTVASNADIGAGRIYGADVESEVTVLVEDFTQADAARSDAYRMSVAEAELTVRENAGALVDDSVQLTALAYIDNSRFDLAPSTSLGLEPLNIRVLEDNVSELDQYAASGGNWFDENIFSVEEDLEMNAALQAAGFTEPEANVLAPQMAAAIGADKLTDGHRFVLSVERDNSGNIIRPMRVSGYYGSQHLVTFARRDDGVFVQTRTPYRQLFASAPQSERPRSRPVVLPSTMPTIYDAIYRTVLKRDLPDEVAKRLISIFASDVDFQTRVRPTDQLELFYTEADNDADDLQVLHAKIKLGDVERRYYRFVTPDDGKIDYYDETGKSAKKFLIRNPVPNGKFRSGFGMRRHPVLRYSKMHTGVDWSARRGTPIIAAGNGTVKKAGWAGGYGKQTLIQHANGYVSSYSHQTAFAKGITPGARVRQGQVIGYVGTTGLSTGPHLHYEVIVNGRKVNPMKIRLPKGRVLQGEMLDRFQAERARIDALVNGEPEETTIASR